TAAIVVRHLRTGASATYHERDLYPSASIAKLPILVETFRQLDAGTLRLDERVTITADAITGGAGVLQAREGEQLPISELLRLAVGVSDNVAARLLLQRVGGIEAVNHTLAGLGLVQTRLYADDRPNTTTAAETAALLAWLATRPAGGAHVSGAGSLPAAPLANTLPALLARPQAQAWLARGVPRGVPVAHKSGQLPSVRHDAGIVYAPRGPYVLVALTSHLADQDDAEVFLANLSRRVYEYFSSR
ncbi:MAG: serine hydrolase, partial [Chloroflexota bacterium]